MLAPRNSSSAILRELRREMHMQLDAEACLHSLANVEFRCRDSFACVKKSEVYYLYLQMRLKTEMLRLEKEQEGRGRG